MTRGVAAPVTTGPTGKAGVVHGIQIETEEARLTIRKWRSGNESGRVRVRHEAR